MVELLAFLETVLKFVPTVAVAAGVIALIVDFLKRIGVLPDGYAPLASLILNAAAWVLVYLFGDVAVGEVTEPLAQILPYVFSLLVSLGITEWAHNIYTPKGLGYSFSAQTKG